MNRAVFTSFLALVLLSCGDDVSSSAGDIFANVDESENLPGFVSVSAKGKSVVLGTDDANAKANERPGMSVKFDYDFYLGEHEVTCGEIAELANESWGGFADCQSDSLRNKPITNVTYYDAVIYANLRSLADGHNASYTYSSATFDYYGHCIGLEGLSLQENVEGYRLPTEAEWMFVATRQWNTEESWNSENSDYKVHDVCSIRFSKSLFCDLAGNVMEWTHDWMSPFKEIDVMDFMGAPDAGGRGERVVKGGSYRDEKSAMHTYSRGDVYLVNSSTRADYIGFRLAFGKIPNPTWMGNDGSTKNSVINIRTTATTIREKVGSYKTQLVFRNDESGNLAYVDFSSGSLSVTEIADTIDSYHPDISPDGSKVAFCTGSEGLSGTSSLYVRDLNSTGSNLVKLNVKTAAIPRWRVSPMGDTSIVYVSDAGNNKDEGDFFSKSTWQVPFSNGKFGTPQKLFDGAYHGGVSEDNRLAVTGARLLRARLPQGDSYVDTVWYNDNQACNVSLSGDGTKRTLFLDFGGTTGREFVGVNYGIHERLLVVDSVGKLVQSVAAPKGLSFDHSEWVQGVDSVDGYVVASLTNGNGSHFKIVLIDLQDSSIMDLVDGAELWHPAMRTRSQKYSDGKQGLNLDSAGVYLTENHTDFQSEFRIKMEMFWKNLSWANVAVVGSSRPQQGIDPDKSKHWNMVNLAISGIDPVRDMNFVENYVLNHSDNLKAVVLSVDLDNWRKNVDQWSVVFDGAPGYKYDENHGYWVDSIPENFLFAVMDAYPAEPYMEQQFSEHGFRSAEKESWDSKAVEVMNDSVFSAEEMKFLDEQLDCLMKISDAAAKKKIYVVGLIYPQAPQYKETGSFGKYGLQRSVAEKKIAWLDSMARERQYFVLMDENKMGNHDYTDPMAFNMDHLSYLGAGQLTDRLDSLLNTLK